MGVETVHHASNDLAAFRDAVSDVVVGKQVCSSPSERLGGLSSYVANPAIGLQWASQKNRTTLAVVINRCRQG